MDFKGGTIKMIEKKGVITVDIGTTRYGHTRITSDICFGCTGEHYADANVGF